MNMELKMSELKVSGQGVGNCCPLQSLQTKAECKKSSSSLLALSEEPVSTFFLAWKARTISTHQHFSPPTQKADPGKAELTRRISPAHPLRVNLALRIFVSLTLCFFPHVLPHCVSTYMARSHFSLSSQPHPFKSLPASEPPQMPGCQNPLYRQSSDG